MFLLRLLVVVFVIILVESFFRLPLIGLIADKDERSVWFRTIKRLHMFKHMQPG